VFSPAIPQTKELKSWIRLGGGKECTASRVITTKDGNTRDPSTDRERENKRIVILVSFKNLFHKCLLCALCAVRIITDVALAHTALYLFISWWISYIISPPISTYRNCCFQVIFSKQQYPGGFLSFFGIGGMEAIGIKSVHTRLNLPQGRSFETFLFFSVRLGPGCKRKIKDRKPLSIAGNSGRLFWPACGILLTSRIEALTRSWNWKSFKWGEENKERRALLMSSYLHATQVYIPPRAVQSLISGSASHESLYARREAIKSRCVCAHWLVCRKFLQRKTDDVKQTTLAWGRLSWVICISQRKSFPALPSD
jgi:hypothetical protein